MPGSLWLLLAGCTPDLTALEGRQRRLEVELARMDAELETLEARVTAAGIPLEAPRRTRRARLPAAAGHQTPTIERSDEARVSVERTGEVPTLARPDTVERTRSPCGFKLVLPTLKGISDYPLNTRGLGRSSPVRIAVDGVDLVPHASPGDYEARCGGAFRHAGTALLFSPPEPASMDDRGFELSLDTRVPVPRGDDGRPMLWVYPATTLSVRVDRWDPSWGRAEGTLAALVIGSGQAEVQMGPERTEGSGPLVVHSDLGEAGPFEISVSSPEGGPWVLVDVLTIGNHDSAVVVTGGQAWDASH